MVVVVVAVVVVVVVVGPSCQRPTDRSKKKMNAAAKEAKMIFLCLRKRSENEGGVSLVFIMESYQASFPIVTENKICVNVITNYVVLSTSLEICLSHPKTNTNK